MHNSDIIRSGGAIVAGLVIGWVLGDPFLGLALALAAYCVWLHRKLGQLLHWLRHRKETAAPDPRGVFEDLCREIDYLRERHKKRKKKLGSYLKQFQQATRALPDSTVVLDENGSVQWANRAATDVLGIRWPEDSGQRLSNLVRVPALLEFIERDEPKSSVDIPSPIDENIQLNVRITPSGNRQRLFVARDITQLHRANQVRSDFVANVSHELRTPITVLRGYLENMTAQRDVCPPAWEGALAQMSDHVSRMQAVVEDLLMLSALEQHDRVDDPKAVPVAELVVDIHRRSQQIKAHQDHIFMLELETDVSILGSYKELYSCISNLIYNAVKYTNERGIIEIHWYRDEHGAHLSIKDNGIGISPEHIPRLTERFYRAESSRARSQGGTGLGLAIVKHVLTRHRANLHVESELGKGSTFRCDFPPHVIVEENGVLEETVDQTA
ncbi:MAG: phosphate regulon sensor histidine kinase PhoR [Gammaproteobacteria bacterium]|jgi:two-component system phosphate regulon sensor histidine kinase PhoR